MTNKAEDKSYIVIKKILYKKVKFCYYQLIK